MIIIVVMLIYAVSLKLQLPACITIHNQCSNNKLVSPIYFGNGAVCPRLSKQRVNIGAKMEAHFEINTKHEFEVALLFKLQTCSKRRRNMNKLTVKTNDGEADCVYMLVACKVKDSKLFLHVTLVEHTEEFAWNKDRLKKLYDENHSWLKEYDSTKSYTWFMNNNIALKTTFKVRNLKRALELDMYVSEKKRDCHAVRPLDINIKR
jgi:hypothetical protein